MTRRETGVDVPEEQSASGDQIWTEPLSPLDGRVPSRRLLHLALGLMLAVPAILWLVGLPTASDGEVVGGETIDEMAPDFSLRTFDGTTFTLTGHLSRDGRPVVMNFWASWCVPCRVEMPDFDAVASRRTDVYFLGVAVEDTEAEARAFADEAGVSYRLGLDADGAIIDRYPILGLPATWFITSEGIIAARWMGQLDQARLESLIEEHLAGR